MAARGWPALRDRIPAEGPLVLLTDYDGTLVPIAPTPEQARLGRAARALLRRLSRLPDLTVGLISGRSLQQVRRMVGIPGLLYVGNHGLEIAGPRVRLVHPGARRSAPVIARIGRELTHALAGIRGTRVESKGVSLSVHWRAVPPRAAARFHRTVRRILAPWMAARAIRVTRGKRVVEVRPPVAWGKGAAVRWLIQHLRASPGRVWYLGDDRTDEEAFRAVNARRGVSVYVGRPRATAARWRLRAPRDVIALLSAIVSLRWNRPNNR